MESDKRLTLKELYEYLDEHALSATFHLDIDDEILAFRDKTTDEKEKSLAQWELECWLFHLYGMKVLPFAIASSAEAGKFHAYPDLKKEDQDFLDYVVKRSNEANNPILKARYYHILWRGPKGIKNKNYLSLAIDNYVAVVEYYIASLSMSSEPNTRHSLVKNWEHLVALTSEMKEKQVRTKELTQQLLFQVSILPFHQKDSIVSEMLKHPNLFKRQDLEGVLTIYEEAVSNSKTSDDFMLANYSLPNAIKVAAKLNSDEKRWHIEIGECYVRIAEKPLNDDPERAWIKQQQLAQAVEAFRKGKADKRKQEVEAAYESLKPKVKLTSYRINYPPLMVEALHKWNDEIKKVTSNLLRQSPDFIYDHLGKGSYFPALEHVKKHSGHWMEPWLDAVTKVQFDINKNIVKGSENEEFGEGFWMQYRFEIEHSVSPFLHYTLIPGIKSGKLNYENFTSYLIKNTWLGNTFQKADLGGENISYNWISIIAPSIVEYFVQMQSALLSSTYIPTFVLCIDSLTLKMEGLLREFATQLGTATSTSAPKGMQEKFIHSLLQDEVIRKHFSEDDRLFFDFLFINKQGLDLRNNIAHSFYQFSSYHYEKMQLLIAALLRIAKYKFTTAKK